ncbi:MAG: GDP-L-fucose synthase [Sulfurimonas sp.]|jgi:GDP-L-fucose synthase|nr:GDP-L-fucose synthase [Sulfurimonas sp.]
MKKNSKIFVAGGTGLVGSAIIKNLLVKGYTNIISNYRKRTPDSKHLKLNSNSLRYEKLDLLDGIKVEEFFAKEKPEFVILAAAKVGGIVANNTYRADFIYENLQVQNNVIHQSYKHNVTKLLFLGSTCIYPKDAPQPMSEDSLLTSPLEYTNEPYAIAKIAGIKMCESYNIQYGTNFISVMPTNLYGPNDNFDLETSHVLPAMMRKMHEAKINDLKEVEIWGTGKPRREFLYSEDMADACVYLMEKIDFKDIVGASALVSAKGEVKTSYSKEIRNTHINIGTGVDISIKELANLIKEVVGFKGELYFNTQKPDGTMLKLTDVTKLNNLGWKHKIELKDGVRIMYEWYLKNLQ